MAEDVANVSDQVEFEVPALRGIEIGTVLRPPKTRSNGVALDGKTNRRKAGAWAPLHGGRTCFGKGARFAGSGKSARARPTWLSGPEALRLPTWLLSIHGPEDRCSALVLGQDYSLTIAMKRAGPEVLG